MVAGSRSFYADSMNLGNLDLNLLIAFDALLRTRSVTLAAEQTGMGQSSMSGALKRLRTALNDPLFVKTELGMTPTALALELAGPIQAGLAQIRSSLESRQAFDPAVSSRLFSIYMSDTGQLTLLPRLLSVIRREAPSVRIRTVQTEIRQANRMLAEGGVDLAIGYFLNIDEAVHRSVLFQADYVCIASSSHPVIQGSCSLQQLATAAHVTYRPIVGSHRAIDEKIFELCAGYGSPRLEVLELTHGLGLAEVVERTDLIACVPRQLAEICARSSSVQVLALPVSLPPIVISQHWHERSHRDAGSVWLRGLIRRLFGTM